MNDLFGIKPMFSDASIISAQREYARNPTTIFERAGKGSSFYMHNLLMNMVPITEGPKLHQLDSLAATIYSFLNVHAPSKKDTAETYKIPIVVLGYVEALYRIAESYDSLGEDARWIFASTIPMVIRILSIGCDDSLRPIPNRVDHSAKLKRMSVKMFLAYMRHVEYGSVVVDILKVSIKMWLQDLTAPSDFPFTVSCMVVSGSLCCSKGNSHTARRILDNLPDLDYVAHLAMKRIRMSKEHSPVNFRAVIQHCNAILFLSKQPRLARRMVEKKAIATLCDILEKTNALRTEKQTSRRTCILALNDLLPVTFSAFREALANDLLHNLFLVYFESVGEPCMERTVSIVQDMLEDAFLPLLLRRSNLKLMLDAAEFWKNDVPLLKRNSLGGPWAPFEKQLLSLAVAHRLFMTYRTSMLYKCENPKCKKLLLRKNTSRCAGCKEALYCGQGCQRLHWKVYGHRYECRSAIGLADALGRRVRDRAFVVHLAANEVVRHRPVLRKMAERKYSHVPLEHIGYMVDFSKPQVSLGVYNIFDVNFDHLYSCMEHLQATRLALEADPRISTLRITLRYGTRTYVFQSRTRLDELNEAIKPSLYESSEQCLAADVDGNQLEELPDVVDGLTAIIRKSVEGKNKKGFWDQSVIEKEVRKSFDVVRTAILL